MKLTDGREAIVSFELPLSMTLVAELSRSIDQTLVKNGYRDVVVDTTNGWRVLATPPARSGS